MIQPSPFEYLMAFAIAFLAGALWSALLSHLPRRTTSIERVCPAS
ncbi:hypothetical protein PCO31110_04190 [Pandoraea communis]|uniref:Uncharacterized protein n=1 Tax=Pandoraea communis TaxID=2508297 RepID=A0A5E4XXA0_9BURK|nr:hypothetical protein LMG16407_01480 [Pandoraea apista]VVE40712.1 hypothetical protein PCO31110_04190 [Pandoraea communis]